MRKRSTIWLLLGSLLLWQATGALEGAEGKRIGVTGNGRVEARPDVMELSATVTGSAEITADALKKFRENRRRGMEAVNKLKVKGLEVKASGVAVLSNAAMQQYQQMFGGNQQQTSPGHTTFSETLTFTVPGIDQLSDDQVQDLASKILDAAKDAGLTMGQSFDPYRRNYYDYNSYRPQIVFFRLEKAEEARQKALDLAAQDARQKAEKMAKRLDVALGKATTARDASRQNNVQQNPYGQNTSQSSAESSGVLHTIPVEAALSVEYEIAN